MRRGSGENCTGTGPAGVNEAPKGAAATGVSTADNPFKFTVDTGAPTLTSGKTGVSLKNPGVTTSGTGQEAENTNKSDWLRVYFDLGAGGAPLDAATVERQRLPSGRSGASGRQDKLRCSRGRRD